MDSFLVRRSRSSGTGETDEPWSRRRFDTFDPREPTQPQKVQSSVREDVLAICSASGSTQNGTSDSGTHR